MKSSGLPARFLIPFANNAGNGYVSTIPQSSQRSITLGRASLYDGFPPESFTPTESGGAPPWGSDFNGLSKWITTELQWRQAGGASVYDLTFCTAIVGYPKGAVLASTASGLFWYSTIDDNTTDPDGGSPTGWIAMGPAVNLLHYGADTGTENAVTVSSITPGVVALTAGMLIEVTKSIHANTGAVTATIAGTSGNILWSDGTALRGGDWPESTTGLLYYNGSAFLLLTSFIRTSTLQPSASVDFYVNASVGNDANDGLSNAPGHAFATIRGAVSTITNRYLSLNKATVHVSDASYDGVAIPSSGVANWEFIGNTSTPASCIISSPNSSVNIGRGIIAFQNTNVAVSGFAFSTYLENLNASGGTLTVVNECSFSAPTYGSVYPSIACSNGRINLYGSNTYTGSANSFAVATDGGALYFGYVDAATTSLLTLTATGTTAFSQGFALAHSSGSIYGYASAVTFSGSVTGSHYYAYGNGVIDTLGAGASWFPGNSSGSTASGGQYL